MCRTPDKDNVKLVLIVVSSCVFLGCRGFKNILTGLNQPPIPETPQG